MACHPNPVFTPEQEARIREIVAEVIDAPHGRVDHRLREASLVIDQHGNLAGVKVDGENARG